MVMIAFTPFADMVGIFPFSGDCGVTSTPLRFGRRYVGRREGHGGLGTAHTRSMRNGRFERECITKNRRMEVCYTIA